MSRMSSLPASTSLAATVTLLVLLGITTPAVQAQSLHSDANQTVPLEEQLRELRQKVALLEEALQEKHTGATSSSGSMGMGEGMMQGIGGMSGKGMMGMGGGGMSGMQMGGIGMSGMGNSQMSGMAGMSGMQGMSGMGGMMSKSMMGMGGGGMSGMAMMGRAEGMGQMQMASSLPGFPGASHIYHIGATGFFLDHPEHITLTPDQQARLNEIKESALLAQSTYDRQIEEAEQQLWVLTSADSPDATAIEGRVGEIAKLTAEKRIAFIRAVGSAAEVLTQQQRETLAGYASPDAGAQPTNHQP